MPATVPRSLQTRRIRRLLLAAAAALAVSLALVPVAGAALGWPSPKTLSLRGEDADIPQVAIHSQDRATVVWESCTCSNSRIQAVRIGADGTVGRVRNLSAAGQDAYYPQVAIDSQDRATVVWERYDGSDFRIQAVRIAADGTVGAVHDLSTAGETAGYAQVAIDSQDRATVAWQNYDGSHYTIQARRIAADGTPEGTPQTLSDANFDAQSPQVAIDSQDRATAAWQLSDGTNGTIQARRIAADGILEAVHDLSVPSPDADEGGLAIDSQDRATVVWYRSNGTHQIVQARRIDADGTTLGTVHDLSASNADSTGARVAIDSQHRATVVWANDSSAAIQSVRIGADGTPGSAQTLSGTGAESPQVAIDSQDRATVVWDVYDGSDNRVQARRIGADGTAEALKTLSAAGRDAFDSAVAIDSQDRPRVAWDSYDGSNVRVQSVRGVDLDLTTAASPDTTIGNAVHDSATVAGGISPTGTLVFRLYGPSDPTCAGAGIFKDKVAVSGNGVYASGNFTPTRLGIHRWTATYSGDSNNPGASTACNDPGESVSVGAATPTLLTNASPDTTLGNPVADAATLAGGYNPTGRILFRLYGRLDTTCANSPTFTKRVTVSGNGVYGSGNFTPSRPGTYRWIATYSGDANNQPAAGACNDPGESVTVTGP